MSICPALLEFGSDNLQIGEAIGIVTLIDERAIEELLSYSFAGEVLFWGR